MASFDYGLNLVLNNHEAFKNQAKDIDKVFNNLAETVENVARRIGGVNFGNLKIDLSGLTGIRKGTLEDRAAGLEKVAKAYANLGTAVKGVDAGQISAINKAFQGGAQSKTLASKADGLKAFVDQAKKLKDLPDLGKVGTQIRELLESFASSTTSLQSFTGFATIAKDVGKLVTTFQKIGKIEVSKQTLLNLETLTLSLGRLGGPEAQKALSILPPLAAGFNTLFKAVRSLSTGPGIAQIPAVLGSVTSTISSLIKEIQALNNTGKSGSGVSTVITQLNSISEAFRNLGIAIRSYGAGAKGVNVFADIDKNIQLTIDSFHKLINAFKDPAIGGNISTAIVPATTAIKELGEAFETLGRKKGFKDFPATVALINTAITTLNVSGLQELSNKIAKAVPALRELAEVAKAVSIVNSQAGKAFVQAARDKKVDESATTQLANTYRVLSSAITSVIPVIGGIVNVVVKVTNTLLGMIAPAKDLAVTLLQIPFNAVIGGFKLLISAITAPINLLIAIGKHVIQLQHEFHLLQIGLAAIIAPFKLLYNIITTLINIFTTASSAVGKFLNSFLNFGKSSDNVSTTLEGISKASTTASANVERFGQTLDNSGKKGQQTSANIQAVNTAIEGSSKTLQTGSTNAEKYGTSVEKVGKGTREASSGINTFASSLNSSNSGVEGAINRLGKLQVTIASVQKFMSTAERAIEAIGHNLIGAGESAFEAAANFQQLQISLGILAGREKIRLNPGQFEGVLDAAKTVTGQVDELIGRFEILAIKSPFTSEQIAQGFRTAQVYGFNAEQAENLTNIIVDTTSALGGNGEAIAEIIVQLGQIRTTGKASLVDLKQLALRGIPTFEILADAISKTTGKATSVADVLELISAGAIKGEFAVNAIAEALKTDFKGAADASTTSFKGLLSTFQDFRANSLRKFATPIIKAILFGQNEGDFGLASLITMDKIAEKLDAAQKSGEELAKTINRVFQVIVTVGRTAQAIFALIPEPIIVIVKNLAALAAITVGVNLAFGILAAGIFESIVVLSLFVNTNTLVIGAVVGMASIVVANYDAINESISNLQSSFGEAPAFIRDFKNALVELFTTGNATSTVFLQFNPLLQSFGNSLIGAVSTIINFATAFKTAFIQLTTSGQSSILIFNQFPAVLRIVASEIFKVLNVFATWESSIASFPTTLGGVATTVGSLFQGLLQEFVTWGSNIIVSFAEGINGTVGLIGQAVQAIGSILSFWLAPGSPPKIAPDLDTWGELAGLEFINGLADGVIGGINNAKTLISGSFSSTFADIGNAILTPFAAIGKIALVLIGGTLVNTIASAVIAFNGLITIIQSLAQGIGNQIGIVLVAIIKIVEVLQKPVDAFTHFRDVVQVIADAIKASLSNLGTTLSGIFSGILIVLSSVITFINGEFLTGFIAMSVVSTRISNSLAEIGKGSRDFLGGVIEALGATENAFRTTLDNVTGYGSNIVQLFADGMIATVSAVSDALSAIADEISYWLAPGSPPRILPDIDQWGTDAAGEFLQGFTKADFDTIGDFGNTVESLLKNLEVEGVDTEKIVEQFAGGLANVNAGGDFGQGTLDQIHFLAGEAGTEVAVLAEKYVQLAKEQAVLNDVTKRYDAQLQEVQGTLDNIERTSGIETNTAKVESLTNALSNNLLSENERTRIQTQIQKLQAESRLKQLEAEKNAQERNTGTAQEALDLQKEQLNLADQFDQSGTNALANSQEKSSATSDKAAKAQDRLNDAVLKYKLQTADTAGKIAIMRGELAKVKEGSEEYYEILTEISRLEEQLAGERERAAKKAEKDGSGITGPLSALEGAQTTIQETIQNTKDNIDTLKKNVSENFTAIKDSISNAWATIKGYLDAWILQNDTVKASIVALGIVFAGVKIIGGISSLGTTLALLSNPLIAIGAAMVAVTAGFAFFAVKSGGFQKAIDTLTEKFNLFKVAFTLGASSGNGLALDFSSFTSAIITIGTQIGAASVNIPKAIGGFFTAIGTSITNGITFINEKISLFTHAISFGFSSGFDLALDFSSFDNAIITIAANIGEGASGIITGWDTFQTNVVGILSNLNILNTSLGGIAVLVTSSLFTYFITPMSSAFGDSETLLGGLTGAFTAFYNGVVQLVTDSSLAIQTFLANQENGTIIEDFFTNTFLGQNLEKNINEAVANIVPSLEGSFDLSTFVQSIVTQMRTLYDGIITTSSTIGTALQPIIDAFKTLVSAFSGEGTGVLANVIKQNKEAFAEFFREIASPAFIEGLTNIGKLLGIAAGAIAAVAAVIIDVALIGLLKNIGDLVIEVGAGIGTLFEAFDLFIQGDILGGFGKVFEGLVQIFDGVFGNIADVIADAVKALLEFFGIDTSGPLGTLIQFVADTVVQFFAFNGILGILGKGWSLLVAAFNKGKAIFAIVTGLFTGTSVSAGVFQKVLGGIQTAIGFVVKKFFTLTAGFLAVKKAFEDTGKNLSGIFENIKSNVTQKFTEIKTNISDSIANFFSGSEVVAQGILFVGKFFTGFLSGLDPKLALSRDGITSGLGLIDLSAVGSAIMSTLGIDSEEIKTALTTKAKALFVSVFTGVKDIAFNIADAIIVTEEQEQALADKISSYLPNLDFIFGEGATEGFALNLADLVTIDTEELDNLQLKFDGLLTILNKFVDVPALGKVFTDAFDTLASFFKGEASLSTTVDGLLDILKDFVNVLPLPQGFKDILTALVGIFTGESSLNTLLDTFKRILGDIYTTLLQAFTNPFTTFIQPIKDLLAPTEGVSNAFTAIKDAITGLLDIDLSGFASIFSPITDTFADLQQKADALVNGIKGLNIIPGFNIGGAEITGGDEVQQKIKSTVGSQTLDINQKLQIITDDDNIAEQSKKLLDAFLASYKENTGLGGYGTTDFAAINKDLIDQGFTAADIETLATSFGKEVPTGLAAGMNDESGELDRATRGLATNLLKDIASELGIESPSTEARDEIGVPFVLGIAAGLEDKTSIISALEALVEAMFSTVSASLNKNAATIDIAKSLFSFNETTVSITKASLDSILKVHDETFNTITNDSIPTFAENFEESFVDLFDTILDLAEEFAGEFLRVIEELNTSVITALGNLRTKITGLTSSFKTAGKALGEAIMKGIIEGVEENIASVVGAINNLFGEDGIESTETFKKAKESGIKIGKEITKGVAEGMIAPDVLTILREAAQKLIEEAQQAVEQAAGIESPSTLFRNYVGRNITSGISLGMIDGIRDLLTSARTIVSEVYTVARDNVGSMFTQGIQDGINSQQTALNTTITSLLDTSVTTAKTALDINSPSGVTYEGVGVPYIDGIITALSDGKGRLSSAAGSLLDVLPSGKNFDYSMNVAKQPVELQYRNLLTSLPSLTQSINLANSGNGSYRHNVGGVLNTYEMMKMQSMQMQNISNMTDSRRSMVSNSNVYHYEMHVNTTPEKSTRVAHNFDMMRVGRKI